MQLETYLLVLKESLRNRSGNLLTCLYIELRNAIGNLLTGVCVTSWSRNWAHCISISEYRTWGALTSLWMLTETCFINIQINLLFEKALSFTKHNKTRLNNNTTLQFFYTKTMIIRQILDWSSEHWNTEEDMIMT
jgi:hypothetical protein